MTSLSHSENNVVIDEVEDKDGNIAILAEGLFLANLLLIPVVPFLVLVYLYRKYSEEPGSVAFNHLRQTLIASVLAGIFIVIIVGVFYFFSSTSAAITWTIILTYLTCVHSMFVMFGIYGLSKAMANQKVKFPLIPEK
jgi:uncharacterized membrane protein